MADGDVAGGAAGAGTDAELIRGMQEALAVEQAKNQVLMEQLMKAEECEERHGALMEKLESIERRLLVDNGVLSVQTRLARHEMVIRAILWAVWALGGALQVRAFSGPA